MPQDGKGKSDNAAEDKQHDIAHGTEGDSSVDRSAKAAPLPEKEKGAGIEGMNASGGGGNVKQGDDVGQGGRSSTN